MAAHDELMNLLDVPSSETRYGALAPVGHELQRSAHSRENPGGHPAITLNTSGPPMIHVTRSFRPEVVVFCHEQRLEAPVRSGSRQVGFDQGHRRDGVTVSKFVVGKPDQADRDD